MYRSYNNFNPYELDDDFDNIRKDVENSHKEIKRRSDDIFDLKMSRYSKRTSSSDYHEQNFNNFFNRLSNSILSNLGSFFNMNNNESNDHHYYTKHRKNYKSRR